MNFEDNTAIFFLITNEIRTVKNEIDESIHKHFYCKPSPVDQSKTKTKTNITCKRVSNTAHIKNGVMILN